MQANSNYSNSSNGSTYCYTSIRIRYKIRGIVKFEELCRSQWKPHRWQFNTSEKVLCLYW